MQKTENTTRSAAALAAPADPGAPRTRQRLNPPPRLDRTARGCHPSERAAAPISVVNGTHAVTSHASRLVLHQFPVRTTNRDPGACLLRHGRSGGTRLARETGTPVTTHQSRVSTRTGYRIEISVSHSKQTIARSSTRNWKRGVSGFAFSTSHPTPNTRHPSLHGPHASPFGAITRERSFRHES